MGFGKTSVERRSIQLLATHTHTSFHGKMSHFDMKMNGVHIWEYLEWLKNMAPPSRKGRTEISFIILWTDRSDRMIIRLQCIAIDCLKILTSVWCLFKHSYNRLMFSALLIVLWEIWCRSVCQVLMMVRLVWSPTPSGDRVGSRHPWNGVNRWQSPHHWESPLQASQEDPVSLLSVFLAAST